MENNYNLHKKKYNLIWTDGKPYERTKRMKELINIENEEFVKNMNKHAYSSSLNYDENTWEILNQTNFDANFKFTNKREEIGDKLSNRAMIQQIGYNPFLSNDYICDISTRDQYLKPINTT